MWFSENGFSMYASAPLSRPSILVSMLSIAESRMNGIWQSILSERIALSSSNPFISGIRMSLMIKSTAVCSRQLNASLPFDAVYM